MRSQHTVKENPLSFVERRVYKLCPSNLDTKLCEFTYIVIDLFAKIVTLRKSKYQIHKVLESGPHSARGTSAVLIPNALLMRFSNALLTEISSRDTVYTSFNLTGVYITAIPDNISRQVDLQFSDYYRHFKEFQMAPAFRPYWDKCMEAVRDRELLSHIIFCNDLFHIPPVKTFLLYYEQDFISITGREDATLELFVKKAIGAF